MKHEEDEDNDDFDEEEMKIFEKRIQQVLKPIESNEENQALVILQKVR